MIFSSDRSPRNYQEEVQSLHNQVSYLSSQKEYKKAIEISDRICNIIKNNTGESLDYVQSLTDLGLLYYAIKDYDRTVTIYLSIINIQEKLLGKEHHDYINTLNTLGDVYLVMQEYTKAEEYYLKAYNISNGDPWEFVSCNFKLANFYHLIGDTLLKNKNNAGEYYDLAERYYLAGFEIKRMIAEQNSLDYVKQLNFLARLYYSKGDLNSAVSTYQNVIDKCDKKNEDMIYILINVLDSLLSIYQEMKNYNGIDLVYHNLLEIPNEKIAKNNKEQLRIINNITVDLAQIYYDISNYDRAEGLFLRALKIQEENLGHDHNVTITTLRNLAAVYHEKGDYIRAEEYHLRFMKIEKND